MAAAQQQAAHPDPPNEQDQAYTPPPSRYTLRSQQQSRMSTANGSISHTGGTSSRVCFPADGSNNSNSNGSVSTGGVPATAPAPAASLPSLRTSGAVTGTLGDASAAASPRMNPSPSPRNHVSTTLLDSYLRDRESCDGNDGGLPPSAAAQESAATAGAVGSSAAAAAGSSVQRQPMHNSPHNTNPLTWIRDIFSWCVCAFCCQGSVCGLICILY